MNFVTTQNNFENKITLVNTYTIIPSIYTSFN